MKHKLLLRQIKKYLGGLENIPPQWEGFLNAVDGGDVGVVEGRKDQPPPA